MPKLNKPIELPHWYSLSIYKKIECPKEWYIEIRKRADLKAEIQQKKDKESKLDLFKEIIINKEIPDYLGGLLIKAPQAIKPLSVFETLYLAEKIYQSKWYQETPHKAAIKEMIIKAAKYDELPDEEFFISRDMAEIPWDVIYDYNKSVRRKLPFTHGSPVTINSNFLTKDILENLRQFLKEIRNEKQAPPPLSKEEFSDWNEKKILTIFDITLLASILEIKYTKMELIAFLWPENGKQPLSKKKIANGNQIPAEEMEDYLDQAIALCKKKIHPNSVISLQNACESIIYQERSSQ